MKIKILETNEQIDISMISAKTGLDWSADFIGNNDTNQDFLYDEDTGETVVTAEAWAWWEPVIAAQNALDMRIAELVEEHGQDAIYSALLDLGDYELEDQAVRHLEELNAKFPEAK